MKKLLQSFRSSSKETQRFVGTIALIGLILVATTFYAYWRLAHPSPSSKQERLLRR